MQTHSSWAIRPHKTWYCHRRGAWGECCEIEEVTTSRGSFEPAQHRDGWVRGQTKHVWREIVGDGVGKGFYGTWILKGALGGPYIVHQGVWIPTRGQKEPRLLDEQESYEQFLRVRFNQQQGTERTRWGTVETDKAKVLLGGKRRASRNESPGLAFVKGLVYERVGQQWLLFAQRRPNPELFAAPPTKQVAENFSH